MELFAIQCTTCQSRLKVRNATIIGDIVACPKCGSMVLVEAPEGWSDEQAAPEPVMAANENEAAPPSPAATKTKRKQKGNSQPKTNGAKKPSKPPVDSSRFESTPPPKPSSFTAGPPAGADADFDPSGDTVDGSRPNINRQDLQPTPSANESAPPALPQNDAAKPQWNPTGNSPVKQIALAVGAGVLGLALAVGMFVVLLRGFSSSPPNPVALGDDSTEATTDNDPNADASVLPSADASDPPVEPADSVAPVDAPETTDGDNPPVTSDDGEEVVDPPTADDGGDPPVEPADGEEPVDPPTDPPEDETPFGDGSEDAAEPVDPTVDPLLNRFADLIDASPTKDTDVEEPATEDPEAIDSIEDEVRMARPPTITIKAKERLADPIAAIEFPAAPLLEFVHFMADYSNTPITIDPYALVESRASLDSALSVDLRNATVADVVNAAFEPYDMHIVAREKDALLTLRSPADKFTKKTFPINDLAPAPADKTKLLAMITDLVEPGSWQAGGGKGEIRLVDDSLLVQNRPDLQVRTLLLLEKLRVARKLEPQSRYAPESLNSTPRTQQIEKLFAKPLTINFGYGERLTKVLQRIHAETGLWVLVDWESVSSEGWNHLAEVEFIAQDEPVGDALFRLATNMDVAVRIINQSTVQLVSQKALQQQHEVEFYNVGELLKDSPETLTARIQKELGDGWFRPVGKGAMFFDEPSKTLIVSLPQPQHVDLRNVLNTWRTE